MDDAMMGMKAADLHHRVTFQQNMLVANAMSEAVNTWVDFVTVYAGLEPLTGKRFWEAKQAQAEIDGIIHTRYYPGITAAMRIQLGTRIFKIQSLINVDERNREWFIYYKEVTT
jgi:SPP1 family predicted phage head-tail adaptor